MDNQSGFADVNGARLYYETAGAGTPFVMIHAGVADSRQWNGEFAYFAQHYRVIRYDQRGFGKSEPVDGEFSPLADLTALLDHLEIQSPVILMGCSMGGGLAMDFVLSYPARAKALIMVGSGPGGLELDTPAPAKFAEAEKAYHNQNWDLLAELETQLFFDGEGRTPDQVDPVARQLVYEMIRTALTHEAKGLGKRLPNIQPPAVGRLHEIMLPVLVIVGVHDTPYILAAADYMVEHLPVAQKVVIEDAAHLPNMEHPAQFQQIVTAVLAKPAR
ncbi:MAG: alpha/beta hydrolase [Anaerolineaceae bacterium]|nr:alpha/beta hydrolase [Anaerolineaceae bacterium]